MFPHTLDSEYLANAYQKTASEEQRKTKQKRHKETFGSDKHVNYLDCGAGCTGVYMYKLKLLTLNVYIFQLKHREREEERKKRRKLGKKKVKEKTGGGRKIRQATNIGRHLCTLNYHLLSPSVLMVTSMR